MVKIGHNKLFAKNCNRTRLLKSTFNDEMKRTSIAIVFFGAVSSLALYCSGTIQKNENISARDEIPVSEETHQYEFTNNQIVPNDAGAPREDTDDGLYDAGITCPDDEEEFKALKSDPRKHKLVREKKCGDGLGRTGRTLRQLKIDLKRLKEIEEREKALNKNIHGSGKDAP